MGCGYGNPDVFGVIACRQSCFAAAGCRLSTVRTGSRIRESAGWRFFPEEGRVRYFCGDALAEGGPALGCPLGALNRWGDGAAGLSAMSFSEEGAAGARFKKAASNDGDGSCAVAGVDGHRQKSLRSVSDIRGSVRGAWAAYPVGGARRG